MTRSLENMPDQPRPGEVADRFLVGRGLYPEENEQRAQLLACFECRWEEQAREGDFPEYTNHEVAACTGVDPRNVGRLSRVLQRAGLVTVRTAALAGGTRPPESFHYGPVDTTEDGIAFQDALEAPATCRLVEQDR